MCVCVHASFCAYGLYSRPRSDILQRGTYGHAVHAHSRCQASAACLVLSLPSAVRVVLSFKGAFSSPPCCPDLAAGRPSLASRRAARTASACLQSKLSCHLCDILHRSPLRLNPSLHACPLFLTSKGCARWSHSFRRSFLTAQKSFLPTACTVSSCC